MQPAHSISTRIARIVELVVGSYVLKPSVLQFVCP